MSLRVLRRASAAIAVTSALIFGAGPLAAAPANAATPALPPSVRIQNVGAGLCLDGTFFDQVLLTTCGQTGRFQHWRVFQYGGHVKINLSANIHYCLNAATRSTPNITVKRCRANDNNQNFVELAIPGSIPWKRLESLANGKCLHTWLPHGTRLATCNQADDLQWWGGVG